MTEARYKFSQRVDNYIEYRPRYPQAVVDLLKSECQLTSTHIIADVGSGTGVFTEILLGNGNLVFGIEPDSDMRAGAEYYLRGNRNFISVAATAESTTLGDHSVDFVTVGQALHWFNIKQARREFIRILAPQGWVVLVWNVQRAGGTPFLTALQQFWETREFWKNASRQSLEQMERAQAYRLNFELARQELLEPLFGSGGFDERLFENPLVCDFRQLKGRILSNDTALEPGDPHYPAMLEALEAIFQTHQKNGIVTIEHDTLVAYGQLSQAR